MQVTQQIIEGIFLRHTHQAAVVEDLYRLALPDYDRIMKINGFPECGTEVQKLIFKLFFAFDKKHHPKVLPGGCWLNYGFSQNPELAPWEIDAAHVEVVYEETEETEVLP